MRPTERESGAVWRLLSAWAREERSKDRFDRKITQGDMARMFGVSDRTLSTWKRCQARMPMATQLRVIKATGIALADLTDALAEDEPRIAEWVAARRETDDTEELMGNAEHPAAKTEPGASPGINVTALPQRTFDTPGTAVASGGGTREEAAEADRLAAIEKAKQQEAMDEMERKKRESDEKR